MPVINSNCCVRKKDLHITPVTRDAKFRFEVVKERGTIFLIRFRVDVVKGCLHGKK